MSVEKASSSSHEYKIASNANTARIADIQINTQPTYDGNIFLKNKNFLLS